MSMEPTESDLIAVDRIIEAAAAEVPPAPVECDCVVVTTLRCWLAEDAKWQQKPDRANASWRKQTWGMGVCLVLAVGVAVWGWMV